MGWFSDSEDDDDEKEQEEPSKKTNPFLNTTITTSSSSSAAVAVGTTNDDDVDVDPLDAYMNTLKEQEEDQNQDENNHDYHHRDDNQKSDHHYDRVSNKAQRFDLDDDVEEDFQTHDANQQSSASLFEDESNDDKMIPHLLPKVDHDSIRYETFRKDFHSNAAKFTNSGARWRLEHGVTTSAGSQTPDPVTDFDLVRDVFPPELMTEITNSGYQNPTPIQAQCLSIALNGHDVIGVASTGSGKTLAYVWPMVVHCCDQRAIRPQNGDGPIAIILSPTRELALQIFSYAKKMLASVGGHAIALFGGMGRYEMSKELKRGAECIIGTPGRIIDMVKSKSTNFNRCTMVILDEADTMLAMGFEAQVKSILESIRPDRQTFMFSATFKTRVAKLAEFYMKNHIRVDIGKVGASSVHVDQQVMILKNEDAKREFMTAMLPTFAAVGRIIIFVATRIEAEALCQLLSSVPGMNDRVTAIHGDKSQHERNKSLSLFKQGKVIALCATDVAARGLDVPNIMTVVNFDPAKSMDAHTHRVGRAGRLTTNDGEFKQGTAYTLLTSRDKDFANSLMQQLHREKRPVGEDLINLAKLSKHYKGAGFIHGSDKSKSSGGVLSGFVRANESDISNKQKKYRTA